MEPIPEIPKTIKIKMLKGAGSSGAVSKKFKSWTKGQTMIVPEGEFDHLGPGWFVVIGGAETSSSAPSMETRGGDLPGAPDATKGAFDLAEEMGVELADVEGTGAGGKITKADVETYLQAQTA